MHSPWRSPLVPLTTGEAKPLLAPLKKGGWGDRSLNREVLRPIYHHTSERVKADIFLCTLAYYVEWHMRSATKSFRFAWCFPDLYPVNLERKSSRALLSSHTLFVNWGSSD
jgi:hypothetical protein